MEKRNLFSSKLSFILAAAGSAVGLGNIWRFPYLAAKYGGGAFLVVYLLFVVTFGFTLMVTEIAIGRKTGLSPIGAFTKLNKKFKFVGVITSLIAFLILPYYTVIGGWVMKYLTTFVTGNGVNASGSTYFNDYIAKPIEPLFWQILFIAITLIVILRGLKNGIEKANKILMPTLIVLSIAVAIYSITLPGAIEGVKYFLIPDFSKLSIQGVLAALGQMFYSMSLAMGIMITFGSYLDKSTDIEKSVKHIEIFDTGIAIIAGLMIIPAVFAFSGGDQSAVGEGPGLMFITLPKVFASMSSNGFVVSIVGTIFFLLVLFAALTSAISLMEAIVAVVCDQFKFKRTKATLIVAGLLFVIGIPSSLGFGVWSGISLVGMSILDMFDFITNSVLMPVVALLTCVLIAYVVKTDVISQEVETSSPFKRKKLFTIVIKYLAPIGILGVLITSVLNALDIIKL